MEIGVQLYTLRDYCKTLDDFANTLKRVADIGYKVVQVSGVCEYDPKWLDEQLKKNGLKCAITHYSYDEIKDFPAETVEKHKVFGCTNIGLGSMPGGVNEDNISNFVSSYKRSAQIIKEMGAQLFYHNHHWEFSKCSDGQLIIDKIASLFDESELQITLDTYWVQYGGADVCDVIDRLNGRLKCVHLKDMIIVGDEQRMAPVGQGNLNFKKIISHLKATNCEYALVEQDNCYCADPFECLKQSYEYLRSIL